MRRVRWLCWPCILKCRLLGATWPTLLPVLQPFTKLFAKPFTRAVNLECPRHKILRFEEDLGALRRALHTAMAAPVGPRAAAVAAAAAAQARSPPLRAAFLSLCPTHCVTVSVAPNRIAQRASTCVVLCRVVSSYVELCRLMSSCVVSCRVVSPCVDLGRCCVDFTSICVDLVSQEARAEDERQRQLADIEAEREARRDGGRSRAERRADAAFAAASAAATPSRVRLRPPVGRTRARRAMHAGACGSEELQLHVDARWQSYAAVHDAFCMEPANAGLRLCDRLQMTQEASRRPAPWRLPTVPCPLAPNPCPLAPNPCTLPPGACPLPWRLSPALWRSTPAPIPWRLPPAPWRPPPAPWRPTPAPWRAQTLAVPSAAYAEALVAAARAAAGAPPGRRQARLDVILRRLPSYGH